MDLRDLFEREGRGAYGLALRVTGSPAAAEDAVSEAFCRLAERRNGAGGRTELFALVWRCAVDAWRSERARRVREEDFAVSRVKGRGRAASPADGAERRELAGAARGALALLSPEVRGVIALACEQGLGMEEITRITGMPLGTVRSHRQRGLERLRKILSGAGFAAVAAPGIELALGGGPAEALPVSTAARLARIATGRPAARALARGTRGGVTMKVIAGVLIAGGLAGAAAMLTTPVRDGPAPAASTAGPSAGLTYEHYAFTSWLADHLDGPRREAVGRGPGPLDEEFNCYIGGRVIRAEDGMVATIAGGLPEFGQDEGPAAFLPRLSPIRGTGYGQSIGGWVVKGLPLKGGDKGCLYAYSGTHIMRVWKNEAKGGRWWAKIVAGPGKVEIPGGRVYQGQQWRKQGEKEYKAVFLTKGGFYSLEDDAAGAKFTCLLSMKSIEASLPKRKGTEIRVVPSQGAVDIGGNYYLGYYFAYGAPKTAARIQRVSPDGAKVEPWVTSVTRKGTDGPGMKTGWHCGPHMSMPRAVCPWYPAGIVIHSAHDEHTLRRVTPDGRVSTLYEDGQWREGNKYDLRNQVDGVSGFVYGANGWALGCAAGEGKSRKRGEGIYLIKGINIGKATVRDGKWGTSK